MAHERLIRTPALDEALAYGEAFVRGKRRQRIWICGGPGVGKSFLCNWLRRQAGNDAGAAIFDEPHEVPDLEQWLIFSRMAPPPAAGCDIEVALLPPEYERRRGVLSEWASAHNLIWEPGALEVLLAQPIDDLTRLRTLAGRAAFDSHAARGTISEVDVLRMLARVGLLQASLFRD